MTTERSRRFGEFLEGFPKHVRGILAGVPHQGGRLSAPQCSELVEELGVDLEEIMVRLLPLAVIYAVAPVSGFQVGAVVLAGSAGNPARFGLYLGANMEFMHQDLGQTIHAEQAAAANAWHRDAQDLLAVATSEPPCGHCRQFLTEFDHAASLGVIVPTKGKTGYRKIPLTALLPESFGPADLGNRAGMDTGASPYPSLRLKNPVDDPTTSQALQAAERSYAPYSRNLAGCAVETLSGEVFTGRYVESAAYNPSLSPLKSAIVCRNVATIQDGPVVQRVVLVERPTLIGQRKTVEQLLGTWAPGVPLEYYEAE